MSFELKDRKTAIYPKTRKLVNDAYEKLYREKLQPWRFFNSKPLRITRHNGDLISYHGIQFEGSPCEVFWGNFIEPFVEEIIISILDKTARTAQRGNMQPLACLDEAAALLQQFVKKVYTEMAVIDQVLRGKGYPRTVSRRNVDHEITKAETLIEEHLNATKALQSSLAVGTQKIVDLDPKMNIASAKQLIADLPDAYAKAKQTGEPLAMLMIDFDDLKQLNDKVGHPNADKVLYAVAQRLMKDLRGKGEIYRHGGDELLAILPNHTVGEAFAVAERLRGNIEQLSHKPLDVQATVSIGVASYPDPISNPDDVLDAADRALLQAKTSGKNKVLAIEPSQNIASTISTFRKPRPPSDDSRNRYKAEIGDALEFFREVLGKGITSSGHWEIVAYPCNYIGQRVQDIPSTKELLETSRIIRGWDFPHSDDENTSNFTSGHQSFVNWQNHREGYRFHQSGLFIWIKAFPEDINGHKTSKGNRPLSVIKAIHIVTDFCLFLKSVCATLQMKEDIHVEITLTGCNGRELAPYDASISFPSGWYISRVDTIPIKADLCAEQLENTPLEFAGKWSKQIFHIFNWNNVTDEFIARWQKRR